jgi:hypothetical protein
MTNLTGHKDQQHPQEKGDRDIIDRLLQESSSDRNLAELARLRIRYAGFPGAREIQRQLDAVLERWQMTEEELFTTTRQLHATGQVYRRAGNSQGQDDWS